MTMFKSDVQSVRLFRGYSYADAVATGRLLCQWYADQSGAIRQSVTLSDARRHGSGATGNGTRALAKCPRSRSQLDWDPGCLVASAVARWSPASCFSSVNNMNETECSGYRLIKRFAQTSRLFLLVSVRSCALSFLKHLNFRSLWMMRWTDDFEMPVSLAIWRTVLWLPGAFSWLIAISSTTSTFISTQAVRGRPLPDLRSADPVESIWCTKRLREASDQFFSRKFSHHFPGAISFLNSENFY